MAQIFPPDSPDLSMASTPDMAQSTPDMAQRLLGCGSIVVCLNQCGDDAQCQSRCPLIGTTMARSLFNALIRCILGDEKAGINGACKSFDGGVCDPNAPDFSDFLCSDCQQECQMPGGQCFNALAACDLHCEEDSECRGLDPQARCVDHTCEIP